MDEFLLELAKYWPHALGGTFGAVLLVYSIRFAISISSIVKQWWKDWKDMQHRMKTVTDNHLKHIESSLAVIESQARAQTKLLERLTVAMEQQSRAMNILLDRTTR